MSYHIPHHCQTLFSSGDLEARAPRCAETSRLE